MRLWSYAFSLILILWLAITYYSSFAHGAQQLLVGLSALPTTGCGLAGKGSAAKLPSVNAAVCAITIF